MKAVVTALAVCVAPGFLLGCASGQRLQSPSASTGKGRQEASYEADWMECRRYAMIDGLLAPDPDREVAAPSAGIGVAPERAGAAVRDASDEITRRCMESRGHRVLPE